ncbi:CU044_2847 family protein [Allorhizocola rhizosphaerae]|uniref:CU044_2847 family protein n=1 Tax=Allorhizocola rhizosphaerae TaxID=1872709 RepID=UPI0013C2F92B|nr:CU044_2847 family protein [Allorhizocola rhizosphaerae]
MKEIVEVELPDGEVILAEVAMVDSDVGAFDRFRLDEARSAISKVGGWALQTVRSSLPEAPDRFGVEIGLKLAVKSGVLTSVLAEASGEASITVKMEWDRKADT